MVASRDRRMSIPAFGLKPRGDLSDIVQKRERAETRYFVFSDGPPDSGFDTCAENRNLEQRNHHRSNICTVVCKMVGFARNPVGLSPNQWTHLRPTPAQYCRQRNRKLVVADLRRRDGKQVKFTGGVEDRAGVLGYGGLRTPQVNKPPSLPVANRFRPLLPASESGGKLSRQLDDVFAQPPIVRLAAAARTLPTVTRFDRPVN